MENTNSISSHLADCECPIQSIRPFSNIRISINDKNTVERNENCFFVDRVAALRKFNFTFSIDRPDGHVYVQTTKNNLIIILDQP